MSVNLFSEFKMPQNQYKTAEINKNVQEKSTPESEKSKDIQKDITATNPVISRKEKFIKTAKTIAPVVIPLAAIPVSVLIGYGLANKNMKSYTKTLSNLSKEISALKNDFGNIKTSVADAGEKIVKQSETVSKLSDKVVKLSTLLAGGIMTYNVGKSTGKDEGERVSYYKNIISNTQLSYDPMDAPSEDIKEYNRYSKKFPYKNINVEIEQPEEDTVLNNLLNKLNRKEDIDIPLKKVPNDSAKLKEASLENLEGSLRQLGENIPIGMNIEYGKRANWNNNKIARDILQNFYDANNHTLNGVGFSVKQSDDGYKIKISGNALYDCKSLLELGSGNKIGESPYNAGGFGEGSRIVVASLLGQGKTDKVTFACADWELSFNEKNNSIMRTLNKTDENLDGNYIEFETKDKDLVETMIQAMNYFENSHNPDFKNLDYNSKDFAFKILNREEKGNLYLTQRFEYGQDGNWENGLEGIRLIFKRKPDAAKFKELTNNDFSKGRDRIYYTNRDIYNLTLYFAQDMSDEELIDTIIKTQKHWVSGNDKKENYAITSFINGLCKTAYKRKLGIDFSGVKMCLDNYYMDASVRNVVKSMGYTLIPPYLDLDDVGMERVDDVKRKMSCHKPLQPTDKEVKKIKLLDEAVKVIEDSIQATYVKKLKNIYGSIKDKIELKSSYDARNIISSLAEMDDADFIKNYNRLYEDTQLKGFSADLINYLDEKIANTALLTLQELRVIANILKTLLNYATDETSKKMRTQLDYLDLISPEDVSKPKYIFDRKNEVSINTLGEAIITQSKYRSDYNGHWVDRTYLNTADFYELLATWLHEISHKSGGDGTSEFTYKLTDLIESLINAGVYSNTMKDELAAIEKVFNEIK